MPDAALDATAEALTRRILAEVPADRPRGAADIDRLPAPLGPLLHARLVAAVDRAAPTASAWLDDENIDKATVAWRRTALEVARIPADVWPEAVRDAASLALAHLVRPADTLAAFAFADGAAVHPVAHALDRARTFGPYPYLPQIAARYADRKELDVIDRVSLEQLFRRIDRRMVSTFGPDDWTTLLSPLLDLVGPVGSPPGAVPTALLRPLFMSKGVGTLAVELEATDSVSRDDLRALLARTLVPADPPPELQAAPPAPPDAPPTDAPTDATTPPPADLAETAPDVAVDAEGSDVAELPDTEEARPPTIGSKYGAPEFDAPDDSEVLGPPVPVRADEQGAEADAPAPEDGPVEDGTETAVAEEVDDAIGDGLSTDSPRLSDAPHADAPKDLDAMAEVRETLTAPIAEPPDDAGSAMDSPEATADDEPVARGSNPLIEPEPLPAPPQTVAEAFVFPDETPARDIERPEKETLEEELPKDETPGDNAPPLAAPAFDDEPLWKRLARERRDAPPAPAAVSVAEADTDDEPLWKRFATSELAAKLPPPQRLPGESPDLDGLEARVLGPDARERRTWYVTELFDGSADGYQHTLARIDEAVTYTEATNIISADVLRAHSVDPYTESMVAFIDAVQDHFDRR